jgi:hypothetical protein
MTPRALLLAAALAWPGVTWGQTSMGTSGGGGAICGNPDRGTWWVARAGTCYAADDPANRCAPARRYTVADIDRMRAAVIEKIGIKTQDGHWKMNTFSSAEVEDRLRTYIAAGITAEELEKQ